MAITWPYFIVSTCSWYHVAPHMMEFQLIYRYDVIKLLLDEHNDDTKTKGQQMNDSACRRG